MIDENYIAQVNTTTDIQQHLPTLYSYAQECTSVAEFGVRSVVSTWALLKGLRENGHKTKNLICVDIEDVPAIHNISNKMKEVGINVRFIKADSATVNIPNVDLLFIDTWHIYAHLKRELENNHDKVRKYIIMHDTEVDKIHGESIRGKHDIQKQARETGYAAEEIARGLQPAIDEFIQRHSQWEVHRVFTHNNGLTILRRK